MPTHLTARLAWHSDGWSGSICRRPERNTYCIGCKSFPGDVIARERQLEIEKQNAGKPGHAITGYVAPCCYSYNAFGLEDAPAASNPPDFFFGGADRRDWTLPPSTVSVWPFEAMYAEEVKVGGWLDNDKRRALTLEFFKPVLEDCGKNFIFYYANYSNPLSENEAPKYVLIGVSRIKQVGEEMFYNNVSPEIASKYAGGMVWARDISSYFPDEGVRLPYHRYSDDPEGLAAVAIFPENPILCKYGSKHVSDDEAIGLLELFLAKIRELKQRGDTSEDWTARETWVLNVIAELWASRGLYPGLLKALDAAGASILIDKAKSLSIREGQERAYELAFQALESKEDNEITADLDTTQRGRIARNWQLLSEESRDLLKNVLPRFDLTVETMKNVAFDERLTSGLAASAGDIAVNPYLLSESYCGAKDGDKIPWSTIDRGVIPSPDLGGTPLAGMELNDERRFRGLCVEHLRREPRHTFRVAEDLIAEISERMSRLPSWKQAQFTTRYFNVDAEFLSQSLVVSLVDDKRYVYLKTVFQDERTVAATLDELISRADIDLARPVTTNDWLRWVRKPETALASRGGSTYETAVSEQATTCERLFRRPFAVVTGAAGTGKTTVIEALIRAVRRTEGEGTSVVVMAPTGKATDRAREIFEKAGITGVSTTTVHSFLASFGWLNHNLTIKRVGGKRATVTTLILDEASMLDLELAAALFRAIDWQQVKRLILVGDPGQLPPIGRGRVFADIIKWLSGSQPDCLGRLNHNLRQLLNQIEGQGSAIMALSELFIVDDEDKAKDGTDASTTLDQEELIARIHAGGAIDKDLDVVYWAETDQLAKTLIDSLESRMAGQASDGKQPYQIWRDALKDDPTSFQILTPHRGELHGVEALNEACQDRVSKGLISRVGAVDGITLSDKVIQYRNRTKSNPLWAYDSASRKNLKVEVFNGEIGIVQAFGFESRKIWNTVKTGYGPRLRRFAVQFSRKHGITVGYGRDVPHDGKYKLSESVDENLELAYAISVHKGQGSEFAHTFVVLPASDKRPVSTELVYTALTRASRHCTLFLERDVRSLLDARRRENAETPRVNSSLFELHVANAQLVDRRNWYEAGKIHEALSGDMLRSKSEVIIANLLHQRGVPFQYEVPLKAGDGTLRLPDFTVTWKGRTFYWEHLGRLDLTSYASAWTAKKAWYEKWFAGQLVTTEEGPHFSKSAQDVIVKIIQSS